MRAQKVPIGPKGEATNQVIFSYSKPQGARGGREPLMPLRGFQLECGHELEQLVRSKMDEKSLNESSKGSNWTQGCGFKPGIWYSLQTTRGKGGQRAADASEGLPAGMWA